MGLLSLMDAILEVPIGVVIDELPLITRSGTTSRRKVGKEDNLSPIYDLMVAREAGDWEKVTNWAKTSICPCIS